MIKYYQCFRLRPKLTMSLLEAIPALFDNEPLVTVMLQSHDTRSGRCRPTDTVYTLLVTAFCENKPASPFLRSTDDWSWGTLKNRIFSHAYSMKPPRNGETHYLMVSTAVLNRKSSAPKINDLIPEKQRDRAWAHPGQHLHSKSFFQIQRRGETGKGVSNRKRARIPAEPCSHPPALLYLSCSHTPPGAGRL